METDEMFWEKNDNIAAAFRTDSGFLILDRRGGSVTYTVCDENFGLLESDSYFTNEDLYDAAMTLSENRDIQLKERMNFHDAVGRFVMASGYKNPDDVFMANGFESAVSEKDGKEGSEPEPEL